MDFEQNTKMNDNMEEWFLVVGDWFRATDRKWFLAFGLVVLLAAPLYFFIAFTFSNLLSATITPLKVDYVEVPKTGLEITEKKIFSLADGTYTGFARVKNINFDWGVPGQDYQAIFKSSNGSTVMSMSGEVFILPSSEKIIVFPRFSSSVAPVSLDLTLAESTFIRPPNLQNLNLEIQRRSIELQGNDTLVNAVIVNRTPFKISRVDIPVLLFNQNNEIIGANYTNINDLASAESRSFQYTWYSRINGVSV